MRSSQLYRSALQEALLSSLSEEDAAAVEAGEAHVHEDGTVHHDDEATEGETTETAETVEGETAETVEAAEGEAAEGETVTFDRVMAISAGDAVKFGAPVIEGAKVTANVLKNGKAKKIYVMKYKPKKNEKKKIGHRQPYTKVQITAIEG